MGVGVSQNWGLGFGGVPIIRNIVHWGPNWGHAILGNYYSSLYI